MARTEQQIQEELVSKYLKNLEYFKKNDPELYSKIDMLSTAINDNLYKERYALEYIKEIDDFDILELESNNYLYKRNIKEKEKELLKCINFNKESTFSNLNKYLYKEYVENYELPNKKYELLDRYLKKDMSELYTLFNDIKSSDKYKYIDKMFFLGVQLGTHIYSAIKKISPKFTFIYEPDLELFRLSLFTTDYSLIASKTQVLYSVMDYENVFLQKLDLIILQLSQFSNYNIKYCKLNHIDNKIIHTIVTKLHLANSNIFDYTKVLHDTINSFSKHINNNKILTLNNLSNEFTFFNNKAVLFVGAGPSLNKNINWLKENQDRFIIVAMGATFKKLFNNNIRVDIVTTVEQQYEELRNSYFNDHDIQFLKDTIILASICTPSKILNKFNKEKLFLFETYQAFKENSKAYNGASVGEVTLSLLLDMNIKNIYLLGIDLAIDEKTGSTHYEGYKNQKKALDDKTKINALFNDGVTTLKDEYLEIKGNTKNSVVTTRVFALSIAKYTELIGQFKKDYQHIYNLSEDSAYIQGIDYLNIDDLNTKSNIKDDKKDLVLELNKISEYGLNKNELTKLKNRIQSIDYLQVFVQKNFVSSSSKNIYNFNEKLEKIFKKILETKDFTCSNILANYLNLSLPYIYASLNDEKITNKIIPKKINNIEKVVHKHLEKILEAYNYYLLKIE